MSLLTYLRPAVPDDQQTIHLVHYAAILHACRHDYDETVLNAWLQILNRDDYLDAIRDKTVWVILYKGKIQGFFQLDLINAELDALYVHPFVHRLGLGTAMLNRAEQLAKDADLGMLKLYASLNSVPFYKLNHYHDLGACQLRLTPSIFLEGRLMRKFLR